MHVYFLCFSFPPLNPFSIKKEKWGEGLGLGGIWLQKRSTNFHLLMKYVHNLTRENCLEKNTSLIWHPCEAEVFKSLSWLKFYAKHWVSFDQWFHGRGWEEEKAVPQKARLIFPQEKFCDGLITLLKPVAHKMQSDEIRLISHSCFIRFGSEGL